jgi:hypothetical protein
LLWAVKVKSKRYSFKLLYLTSQSTGQPAVEYQLPERRMKESDLQNAAAVPPSQAALLDFTYRSAMLHCSVDVV